MSPEQKRALVSALGPIVSRVRTDISAIRGANGVFWTKDALSNSTLERHVNGGPARGACPIKEGQSVTMLGVLDLDSHRGETPWSRMVEIAMEIAQALTLWGMAPTAFRSTGGNGIHLYVLWDDPQDAYSVRQALRSVIEACGYRDSAKGGVQAGSIEVFPRQDEVSIGENGNQFILPLAGASEPLDLALGLAMGREHAVGMSWPVSDPVPVLERPARAAVAAQGDVEPIEKVTAALSAIPNDANIDYFKWRDIGFAVHEATGGSDEGRDAFMNWSAQSPLHDEKFALERVWEYIKPAERRSSSAITRGTLFGLAREHGYGVAAATDVDAVFDEIEGAPDTPPPSKAKRRGIPEALHLCTDHANVQRLLRHFGRNLLVASDRWFAWDKVRWVPDDAMPTRYALGLSRIIANEAKEWESKKADTADEDEKNKGIAKALKAWSTKAEMRSTIDAALALAKRMLVVNDDLLDKDPWLINCPNGTVDIRTGELRAHDPNDYITKVCSVAYDPAARSALFDEVLRRVCCEETGPAPVSNFLKRWFGYCATASTREQKFVVHYGLGSNGKSTILDIVSEVMGEYAGTAAPGLLMSGGKDRHPTEIADLFGRRMVTAHESNEGGVLREDFIKQATGSDRIKARFMRADFFEFAPTHKLQLLTNHKPTIKGQDHGIWRRVVMVPYKARFGTADEVASGKAMFLKDEKLVEKLQQEKAAVLAWIVAGALEWHRDGLRAPDSVLAASSEYQREQDRMLHFLNENCDLGGGYFCRLAEEMGEGVYQVYERWCKESGFFALSKTRFVQELERLVPGFNKKTVKETTMSGRRRDILQISGLRLMS